MFLKLPTTILEWLRKKQEEAGGYISFPTLIIRVLKDAMEQEKHNKQ